MILEINVLARFFALLESLSAESKLRALVLETSEGLSAVGCTKEGVDSVILPQSQIVRGQKGQNVKDSSNSSADSKVSSLFLMFTKRSSCRGVMTSIGALEFTWIEAEANTTVKEPVFANVKKETESKLHCIFKKYHMRGEWFAITPDMIESACKLIEN